MSWTERTKPTTDYEPIERTADFLLQENGDYLLLETGYKIILTLTSDWTERTAPTTSWST